MAEEALLSPEKTPVPMKHFHLRRLFRHRENVGSRDHEEDDDEEAINAMADRMQKQKEPKLQRRNALKNISYDAFGSSSYNSSSSASLSDDSSSAKRSRSLDIVPFETSFRIEGNEGDMDRLYQSLGISGPEDFAIPADAWAVMKARSSSDVAPGSRLGQIDGPIKQEEEEEEALDVDEASAGMDRL